jgi:hypothetical protein
MKRGKSRRTTLPGYPIHKHPPVTDRRIVPIDDGPLRKHAAKDCKRAMAKLEAARAELRRYEQEDGPAFGRWMAGTFGALMTELRDNARLIQEQESLLQEVEMEMMWSNHHNPRKAYAAVMKRRESPDEDDDFGNGDDGRDEADSDSFEEKGAEIPKEERKALFDDFVRSVLGFDPRQMSKAEYARMFAEFEAELFGKGPEVSHGSRAEPSMEPRRAKPSVANEKSRIKEIYRTLVRRLHPDTRADGDATVSALWHEVQAAYEAKNLDRLETLLALTEMENGTNGGQASLSHIRGALAEINRAIRSIQRSIGEAKRSPAWGFCRNPYHGPLEKRLRREMQEARAEQQSALAELKRILDDWSRPWHPPAKKPRQHSRPREKPKADRSSGASHMPQPLQAEFFGF